MCGIAGIRRFDGQPVEERALRAMAGALVHRGPDDEGYFTAGDVGFGHRRLSIIDLSGSRQPLTSGPATICFNGEVFNYKALRADLAARGHEFATQGDTEVLLALFRVDGAEGIRAAEGQFAHAIFDARDRALWLFRDRLGVLPLYYYWDGKVFAFASEIKALLPALPRSPEVDVTSVREYLAYRSVPWPNTLFRNVRKLAPGHWLRLSQSGELRVEPYWSLPTEAADASISDADALRETDAALRAAVENRLVADVPVGAYLSGGVDSSLIVALMRELGGDTRVETFSAGFDDPRFDELPYARQVSELLQTRHHEVIVKPTDFQELWHKLTWHRDAPISEPADLAIFRLASLARDSVKVLLSGEGSDELFAGYPKYAAARAVQSALVVPGALRSPVLHALEHALPARFARFRILIRALTGRDEAEVLRGFFAPFTADERAVLLPGEERDGHRAIWSRAQGDLVQRMLYTDCHTWLVDNLLERGDRMAMAASVESRPPFMDHRLVELAFRLPSSLKVRSGTTKWLVKEIARKHLPASIVDRKKVGFRVPLDAWFRTGLRDMARDLLLSRGSFVSGQLDRAAIAGLLHSHESGRRDEEIRIWTLLCLEVWYEVFFRGRR